MPSFIRNQKEFWAGIMFLVFGLAAVFIAQQDYEIGRAGRMGPGYFPTVLGGMLSLVGLVSVIRSMIKPGEAMERLAIKQTFFVLLGVGLFAVLVRGAGLVVAIIALTLVSAYASSNFKWKSTVLLAVGACVFCVLVFVKLLGLPIPVFGPWLGF